MANEFLLINGSPRPQGNSARLTEACCEALGRQGLPWERIDLRDRKIGPCRGCWACREHKAKYCVQKDDMAELYDKVADCRGLLLLSPIYFFTVTAQLKGFIDRLDGLLNWNRAFLAHKPVGAVLVYADPTPEISGAVHAMATLEHLFRYLGADCRGFVCGTAENLGDAGRDADLMERARRLALGLAR